jgi:hypothetical protein
MATLKEQLEAITVELTEEKRATKRARTERDNYKGSAANLQKTLDDLTNTSAGKILGEIDGESLVIATIRTIESRWQRRSLAAKGASQWDLEYDDGEKRMFTTRHKAMQYARGKITHGDKRSYLLRTPTASATQVERACEQGGALLDVLGGAAIAGPVQVSVKEKAGKVVSMTLTRL